tara:strand:+ start:420 stop:638 length:219 start_codon:yes stop_codon:yes gene_type:complete
VSFITSGWLRVNTLLEKKSESRLILVVTTLVVTIEALCPKPNSCLNGSSDYGILPSFLLHLQSWIIASILSL